MLLIQPIKLAGRGWTVSKKHCRQSMRAERELSGKQSGAGRKSGGAERSGERDLQKNDGAERSAEQEVAERRAGVKEIG